MVYFFSHFLFLSLSSIDHRSLKGQKENMLIDCLASEQCPLHSQDLAEHLEA